MYILFVSFLILVDDVEVSCPSMSSGGENSRHILEDHVGLLSVACRREDNARRRLKSKYKCKCIRYVRDVTIRKPCGRKSREKINASATQIMYEEALYTNPPSPSIIIIVTHARLCCAISLTTSLTKLLRPVFKLLKTLLAYTRSDVD
jgi:hypothetical protein